MKYAIFLLAAALVIPRALGGTSPTECDRMASNPEDPDRVATGVERKDIDLPKAIAVCESELAADSTNARVRYQLARVLFYAGQTERAAREMRTAADAGYRQAQFVFGALISNRRSHAPTDICVAERYWLLSARNGRQAARVSYVRHFLNGRFDSCNRGADLAEMNRFLTEAASAASNYYEGMLIEDLGTRLGAVQQQNTVSN
jgi:TPR repeat protein